MPARLAHLGGVCVQVIEKKMVKFVQGLPTGKAGEVCCWGRPSVVPFALDQSNGVACSARDVP